MSAPRVVTIDGAAGSGKSTLARGLALALALPYVNTGLMYRGLTLVACDRDIDPDDGEALARALSRMRFDLDQGSPSELSIDGSPPRSELTSPVVEAAVSHVARHEQVRTLMRAEQRRLGMERGAVMEGRDIGALVFSDAPVKLYLEADAQARARRRASEREGGNETRSALHDRDRRDMRVNPFEPSEGAVAIDTTALGIEAVLEAALAIVSDLAPELVPPRT